jgi:hypothetical protein
MFILISSVDESVFISSVSVVSILEVRKNYLLKSFGILMAIILSSGVVTSSFSKHSGSCSVLCIILTCSGALLFS